MANDKPIRHDAKLKNLPAEALEDLWRFRNPEEGGERLTLEAIAVEVPLRWGFTVSLSTLSEFYVWLCSQRRYDAAARAAEQAREELAKDPNATAEDLSRVAQRVFTSEAMERGDWQAFVAVSKLELQKRQLELDRDKLSAATRSKLEAGLDALFAEIKGNAKAEVLFRQLQEVVAKA